MTSLYNRTEVSPFTRATAEQVNSETAKIQSAIDALKAQIDGLVTGTPLASYTWVAFADSADGTANFTNGEAGARRYIGLAYNRLAAAESSDPTDYAWTIFQGVDGNDGDDGADGEDGDDGADGNYRDIKFISSNTQPVTPIEATPAGWSDGLVGDGPHWITIATKNAAGLLLTAWSTPTRLTGAVNRGAYDAAATYYAGELVTFNGGTYALSVDTSTGNSPTGTDQPNSYWEVVASPGAVGAPATPPGAFTSTIDLTASASGVNLRTIADAAGYTGMSNATITFRVPAGVTIQGLSGGGKAIDTGTWPTGSYTVTLTLIVQSGGKALAGGGNGGIGGSGSFGDAGGVGGDAVFCRVPISITNDVGGEIKGGGGGGGGGLGDSYGFPEPTFEGGGGGGGGFPNGVGAEGGYGNTGQGNNGADGSVSGGGVGGVGGTGGGGNGGSGGNAAANGQSVSFAIGGAAGFAVRKNGYTVPVTNNGTMAGTAA